MNRDMHVTAEEWRARYARPAGRRRGTIRAGARWGRARSETWADGHRLVYYGYLPTVNGHQINRFARSRCAQRVRQAFGTLPAASCVPRFARVRVTRVLGPGQRAMDRDSLAALCSGVIDGLQPLYLWNDNETWSDITYTNDASRRQEGPYLEIEIAYRPRRDGDAR